MTPKRTREFVFASVVLREELSKQEGDYYAETVRRLKTVDGRAAKKKRRHSTLELRRFTVQRAVARCGGQGCPRSQDKRRCKSR